MFDRTDHNRLAEQFAQRMAASVPVHPAIPLHFNPATTAAKVATEGTSRMSSLFKPAEVTSAYMKLGLLGFQGSGKTKTASKVVIGLVRYMQEHGISYAGKPVMFLDTETGSDWVIPDFKAAGIRLEVAKTRAFSDLLNAVDEAEAHGSALIIDSITHYWVELTQSYMKMKKRTRLQFEDWGYLKSEWAKFTDRYVNSSAHIALCGRAGFEYDYTVDEETQKKNLEKTGVKMKAEGEMGYEPSLLVLMERQQEIEANKIKRVWRTATVLKDRAARLDGQSFEDPGFEQFLPHIELLNLGGRQMGVDTSRNSQHMITVDKRDWQPVQRKICIDEIQTLLTLHFPSQSAEDKKNKLKALLTHLDATWTEIEEVMPLCDLRAGYDSLYQALEQKPSKYASAIAADARSNDLNDALPDFSALKDLTPSPELLASRLVVEAAKNPPAEPGVIDTTTLAANGIPAFLDRTQPARAEPSFDEPKWLAELTRAFEECLDFVSFGQKQQALMNPGKPQVSASTWEKATKLARRHIKRLTETEMQGGGSFAGAAE
jgi:hypothetical protein